MNEDEAVRELKSTVVGIAKYYGRPHRSRIHIEDLIQYGMIGLLAAVRKFRPSDRVPFNCYARMKITYAIKEGLRREHVTIRPTASKATALMQGARIGLDDFDSPIPHGDFDFVDSMDQVDHILSGLDERSKDFIVSKHIHGHRHDDIARKWNISPRRGWDIYGTAMKAMRAA